MNRYHSVVPVLLSATRRTMRIGILSLVVYAGVLAAAESTDWRKTDSSEEKVGRLVEALPSTGHIMIEMGTRYQNLYWAAKLSKWEFAEYQADEIEELFEQLMITSPKRANGARDFLDAVYPKLPQAITARDWKKFSVVFESMRQECMTCHVKSKKSFLQLPVPKAHASPVLSGG